MSVQTVFNKYASQYDLSRNKLIPCYDDFYNIAIEVIPFCKSRNIEVLDLGAGTGLLAGMIAAAYYESIVRFISSSFRA